MGSHYLCILLEPTLKENKKPLNTSELKEKKKKKLGEVNIQL